MSANGLRHFRDSSGEVVSARAYAQSYVEDARYTEVVVIDGPLPEVEAVTGGWLKADGLSVPPDWTPATALRTARAHLAIAAHLREHPPVDEEQVAIVQRLREEWAAAYETSNAPTIFDWAIRNGYRIEKVTQ